MIIYLHGFRSSPQSFKARLLGQRLAEIGLAGEYMCPQLPASPKVAIDLLRTLLHTLLHTSLAHVPAEEVTLVGSSLGGYYANWLAEETGCRAVLINPAVSPPRDLEKYVGVTTAYHSDEVFEFKREYVDELKAFAVERITRPERYLLLAATGDEVLDWREMVRHYVGAAHCVIEGSDHGLSDFADYLDQVVAFCRKGA